MHSGCLYSFPRILHMFAKYGAQYHLYIFVERVVLKVVFVQPHFVREYDLVVVGYWICLLREQKLLVAVFEAGRSCDPRA